MIAPHMQVVARFAVAACGAALTIACGSGPLSPPTAPTQTLAQSISSGGPMVLTGPYIVSGVVSEGNRPIGGANVSAWVDQGRSGYSYMWAHGALFSDAAGRYALTGLPAGVRVWLQTWKDGYVQQCAAPQVTVSADTVVDVQLVSKANLSASSASAAVAGLRSVSGVIVEIKDGSKQPVAGASVDFEPLEDFPAAITNSDAAGRFLLCGLPQDEPVFLGASSGINRVAYLSVPPGQTAGIEITLP
jgi:hypothetical protein